VHSTTGEIPGLRFANANTVGSSLFRPFALPKAYTSTKDIFCMRERRIVHGYRRISLFNHRIQVPNVLSTKKWICTWSSIPRNTPCKSAFGGISRWSTNSHCL
jgi:hypothetical protein